MKHSSQLNQNVTQALALYFHPQMSGHSTKFNAIILLHKGKDQETETDYPNKPVALPHGH